MASNCSHSLTRTSTTPHENKNHIQRETRKTKQTNTAAFQGMDIKIPPREGKIKHLGQPITFEDVVRHRQESTFPQYFRRHGDTITPPRIRYVDDDGRDED